MKNRTIAVLLVIVGLGSLLGSIAYQAYSARSIGYLGQQPQYLPSQQPYPSGNGGMMGQRTSSSGESVTIQEAIEEMRNVPSYASVDSSDNTVVFDSQQVSIFVLALMPDRAANLTGRQMPNYATGDVFVIYGLINPTLLVPRGAYVQFTVVNLDDDMYHNLVVSSYGPPFGYMPMQGMMSGGWMPYLPPADYNSSSAQQYSYMLQFNQPGIFWYICTYPSHAASGMYGRVIVTG